MTTSDRFDRRLPEILEEISQPRTPDYFDDLLGLTARTRQRPAWTLLERWLPMVDIARQPAFARPVPWRQIAVLALIGLLVAAGLAVVIGSQQRLPAPFGLARNGLVAYALSGDIYTADPVTGTAKPVTSGPGTDFDPVWSLDGARIAFERNLSSGFGPGSIYVAKADGADLTLVTPEPIPAINSYAFSPDGREIVIENGPEGATFLSIAKSDGSGVGRLDVGSLNARNPVYRAPDGREIIFVGTAPEATALGQYVAGLYAIKPDGSGLRTIVAPTNLQMFGPRTSPDGTQIAYNALGTDPNPEPPAARVFIVDADGGAPRLLRDLTGDDLESVVAWSNDGKLFLISGCYRSEAGVSDCPSTMEVVPVNGSGPVIRIDVAQGFPGADGTQSAWAPDDGSIITTPLSLEGTPMGDAVAWDALTGRSRLAPWNGAGGSSWQRLAP